MPDPTLAPPTPDGDPTDRRHAERRRGEQRRVERALWQGAVGLLLGLIAIGIALAAGWRMLALERAIEADRGADRLTSRDHERLAAGLAQLEARSAANAAALAHLEPLPAQVEALNGRVAAIESRIEAPQRAVARVEAAHLVELAAHRLALERDVRGAIVLLGAADARLASLGGPGELPVRAQLARDLNALRAVAEPDVGALGARLAAAEASVRTLPLLGTIKSQFAPPGTTLAPQPGLARAWQKFTTALQDLVSVRRVSDATVQLVSMEEMSVRRHHLETLLFAARLAALRADQADYLANLGAARDWLQRYFDGQDAGTRAVTAELGALAASRVSPDLPDVSGTLRLLHGAPP